MHPTDQTSTVPTYLAYPTVDGGVQNGSSVGICARCVQHVLASLAPTCMLSRCSLAKISASEVSRKFIKSVLLVG